MADSFSAQYFDLNQSDPKKYPIMQSKRWKLHWLTMFFVLVVGGTVFYLQIHDDVAFISGMRCHYAKGWPAPFYYEGDSHWYWSRLFINILCSTSLIASTLIVFQAWASHKFQFSLKTIFLIQLAIALLFSFRCCIGPVICEVRAPWYLQTPLGIGLGCLFFCLVWMMQKTIMLLIKSSWIECLLAKFSKKRQ
jgi:hypothetical protein